MNLVFGGAYQGKTEYAKRTWNVETVCDVSDGSVPDFTKSMITGLEGFVLECVKKGEDPKEFFMKHRAQWEDKILIVTDISQGIVPVDEDLRAAREANGRLMLYLAGEAEQVHRVFCGIGKRLK